MPIILLALVAFVLFAFGGLFLLSFALRYRAGTARRQARRWAATMNVWATSLSAALYFLITYLISFWLGPSLRYALAGLVFGGLLGLLGHALTRWEVRPEGLFYTPSRWLALITTFIVIARLAYGWWRSSHPVISTNYHWLINATATQFSVAVGAGMISYYLVYAIGVRLRISRYAHTHKVVR